MSAKRESQSRGRLISVEGSDGAGKSTQLERMRRWLGEQGLEVRGYREPGGTAVSEEVRRLLLDPAHKALRGETELLLYTASRMQLLLEQVLPDLGRGCWVLLDRFADSTTAYQGYGRGLPMELVEALNSVIRRVAWPERTYWLDLDPETGLKRVGQRADASGADRLEREDLDFFRRVRAGYEAIHLAESERVLRIDACASEEAVFEALRRDLETYMAGPGSGKERQE